MRTTFLPLLGPQVPLLPPTPFQHPVDGFHQLEVEPPRKEARRQVVQEVEENQDFSLVLQQDHSSVAPGPGFENDVVTRPLCTLY